MKYSKQILEAVNRGIKLALDDFEDDEVQNQEPVLSKKKIKNEDTIISFVNSIYEKINDNKQYFYTGNTNIFTKEDVDFLNTFAAPMAVKGIIPKYKVNDIRDLRPIVYSIISIDNKANLNWIDTSGVHSMFNLFYNTDFNGDISDWDVSNVSNMVKMFNRSSFNGNLSKWDVSHVTDMQDMFANTSEFNNDSICNWDVSHAEDMSNMFSYAVFNQSLNKWDVSHVRNMKKMFYGSIFNGDISDWDVSYVSNMDEMFASDYHFYQDLSKWNLEMLFKKPKDPFRFTDMQYEYSYWPQQLRKFAHLKNKEEN